MRRHSNKKGVVVIGRVRWWDCHLRKSISVLKWSPGCLCLLVCMFYERRAWIEIIIIDFIKLKVSWSKLRIPCHCIFVCHIISYSHSLISHTFTYFSYSGSIGSLCLFIIYYCDDNPDNASYMRVPDLMRLDWHQTWLGKLIFHIYANTLCDVYHMCPSELSYSIT